MDKSSSKLCITQSQTHLVKNLALDLKTSVIISNVAMDIGVHAPFQIIMFSWKIMASGPITSWEIDGETVETVSDFFFWGGGAPKSLQMVTAAMKLKDAYSLEEKLWPT